MKALFMIPALALTFTLGACHHGVHGKNSGKHVDWMAKRIESNLDISAQQKPAWDTLVSKVKVELAARQAKSQAALRELKAEVEKPTLDIERISALAKARLNDRLSQQEIDGFIDEVAGFLKQLSPAQQNRVAELVKDRLDWLD